MLTEPEFQTAEELRENLKKALVLLALAKCPNCDGSGGTPVQVAEGEWEQEQCQWCHEKWELAGGE